MANEQHYYTGPHVYPYRMVGVDLESGVGRAECDEIPIFAMRVEEVHALFAAYSEIATAARNGTQFVTFARGGMPLMDFVVADYCREMNLPLQQLHERFLLLPSYKWNSVANGQSPKELLLKTVEQFATDSALVIADLSFTGDTVTSIRQAIIEHGERGHALPGKISLFGVLDSTRVKKTLKDESIKIKGPERVTELDVKFRVVSRLLTEDEIALLGYRRLRSEAVLGAEASSGVIVIYDGEGGRYAASSRKVGELFRQIFSNVDEMIAQPSFNKQRVEGIVKEFTAAIRRNASVVSNKPAQRAIEDFEERKIGVVELLDRLNGLRVERAS